MDFWSSIVPVPVWQPARTSTQQATGTTLHEADLIDIRTPSPGTLAPKHTVCEEPWTIAQPLAAGSRLLCDESLDSLKN